MVRRRQVRALEVWMNGERVGRWSLPARGSHEFRYEPSWLDSPHARPISLTFPLRPAAEPYRHGVESYFDNLLPDRRELRERIQRRFRTPSSDAFDLLREIGRDCVGALQLLPEGEEPAQPTENMGHRLSNAKVAQTLAAVLGNTLFQGEGGGDDFRISIAGAQEKTALLWHRGAWHRPTGATPTTHIFKLPLGVVPEGIDLSTSIENEWLCARILKAYDIPVAACRIATFGEYRTLIVERFDRKLSSDKSRWLRLPQEDFCQATGTRPALKYETEGGPGIRRILDILRGSERAEEDRRDFLRTQLVFWLLAAMDGHAKNFSLFLLPGGSFRLTPRYDVLSAYPFLGHGQGRLARQKIKMAMAVWGKNRYYQWDSIEPRHWMETARQCGVQDMPEMISELVDRTPQVLAEVRKQIPARFPATVAEAILDGLRVGVQRLGGG
ncbi:MAG: type II toxin-antitoxin system HipA family toxin [Verrucomicrobiae bacterium]|nr:type II toxin-antitoxin system HipA family toxin [Verrucomicrobiae bacterium]